MPSDWRHNQVHTACMLWQWTKVNANSAPWSQFVYFPLCLELVHYYKGIQMCVSPSFLLHHFSGKSSRLECKVSKFLLHLLLLLHMARGVGILLQAICGKLAWSALLHGLEGLIFVFLPYHSGDEHWLHNTIYLGFSFSHDWWTHYWQICHCIHDSFSLGLCEFLQSFQMSLLISEAPWLFDPFACACMIALSNGIQILWWWCILTFVERPVPSLVRRVCLLII